MINLMKRERERERERERDRSDENLWKYFSSFDKYEDHQHI
jgi:hypothetical protein